ncbi:hypothetical protein ES703_110778 [subsurface metagenome]
MVTRDAWIRSQCSGKILDIGAADGWVFKGNGLNVTSLDINEFAPSEFPRIVSDAHNLPLDDGSFDCCVLAEILEHVNNPILVLKEAARVAKKKVIFTVPDEGSWTPDHLPFRTLDDIEREEHLTPEQLYKRSNPSSIKVNDPKQTFHNRWYTKELLESHLGYLGLPYQIQTIAYDGWSWFCGVVLKNQAQMPEVASIKYKTKIQPPLHLVSSSG